MQRAVNEEIENVVQCYLYLDCDSRLRQCYFPGGRRRGVLEWVRASPVTADWELRIGGAHSKVLADLNHFHQEQLVLTAERLITQRLGPNLAFLVVCFL